MLSKEEILALKPNREAIAVPEWGGTVYVRALTFKQTRQMLAEQDKGADLSTLLIAFCTTDESGKALFDLADVPQLEEQSAAIAQRILTVAQRLNDIGGVTAEKNS